MSDDGSLEWRVFADVGQKRKRSIVVAVAFGAGLVGGVMVSPIVGVLGCLALFASTAELFLGVKYRLDEEGAVSQCGLNTSSIKWRDVKRAIPSPSGVRLSPLASPSRLDEFRGVFLRFSDNEEAVWGKIRQFWKTDGSALDRGTDGSGEERSH